ncbi:MAG: polysaccharide export protein EpsE [Gammaproteobacteria bacterium]|nr:polysaccharide export protein EpsE [Gammaproteobacteria bacterium]
MSLLLLNSRFLLKSCGQILLALILLSYSLLVSADTAIEYRLGIDDTVKVSVFQQPDLTTISKIDASGRIALPLVGEIVLAGLTKADAERAISEALKRGGYLKNPQVSILVEQYQSAQVSVLGYVNGPGRYVIERTSSVIDMLANAGGLKVEAGDVLLVVRGGGRNAKKTEVDLLKFQQGDLSQNIELKAGDLVLVPRMEEFYIYGEVKAAGIYRLRRNMTVMQGLSVGGGLTDRGSRKKIVISRQQAGKVIEKKTALDDTLQANDVIYVKESIF